MIELKPTYEPKDYENRWWEFWIKEGLFKAKANPDKEPYTILMPPPNVTSQAHMGHGTCYAFQDLLVRWKRMCGFEALWLPGTDHAGIATQMMVEKDLEANGSSRKEIGREAFVERCMEWKDKYGGLIKEQFAQIGFSADWDRDAYTMDPHLSYAVRYVFVSLYNDGLIYRGERLVNWDCALQTAISDDEIDNKEINGHLWYLKYPVEGTDDHIMVATTRPETMLGDTAVAVNPEDERYKNFIGKKVALPLCDRSIPIIADEYVKSEFGTGAVKITPAHDPNDFEMGKRHNLPFIQVMNDDGTMSDNVPEKFRGLDRFEARKEVVKAFKELELFEKTENHKHAVPHSDRSKTVIEPKLSLQWYVKMDALAKPAAEAARDGTLQFIPEAWKKTYLYWLDNIQDWCISRQLWWGHRIPIWYCSDCDHITTGLEDPSECGKCQSKNIKQDEDVLDTWFSSWLWPLSPFGWPSPKEEKRLDFDYFYPSNVLITGPDIIFLWVARMIMAGLRFKGKVPFRDNYFSAIVTDKQGRKFSKTLGNGIDPMEVIDKFGADAVRFTGVSLAPLGGRIMMSVDDFDSGARFVNKIWNAARFLFSYLDEDKPLPKLEKDKLDLPSRWLLTELSETAASVNQNFENYRLNDAVDRIYHFVWGGFCDWAIEAAKPALQGEDAAKKDQTLSVLIYTLDQALRLVHPIMPFVSEELWQKLPSHPDLNRDKSIVIADYPQASKLEMFIDQTAAADWASVQELVTAVRSAKQQVGIPNKTKLKVYVKCDDRLTGVFQSSSTWINTLANLEEITSGSDVTRPDQSLAAIGKGFECYIPAAGLVDFDKEKKRLATEINRIEKIVKGLQGKLGNDNFVKRAPADVVAQSRAQLENMEAQLTGLRNNLESLS